MHTFISSVVAILPRVSGIARNSCRRKRAIENKREASSIFWLMAKLSAQVSFGSVEMFLFLTDKKNSLMGDSNEKLSKESFQSHSVF